MKKFTIPQSYRSLLDVYVSLTHLAPAKGLAAALQVTPQGLRHKCTRMQFFTEGEREVALLYLDQLIEYLKGVRAAVAQLPCRVEVNEKG